MSKIEEKKVEKYLVSSVKLLGGEAYKFTSPNRRFVPDRLCVLPFGIVLFVEVKGSKGELHSGQVREINRLRAKGHAAVVVDSIETVTELMDMVRDTMKRKMKEKKEKDVNKQDKPIGPNTGN